MLLQVDLPASAYIQLFSSALYNMSFVLLLLRRMGFSYCEQCLSNIGNMWSTSKGVSTSGCRTKSKPAWSMIDVVCVGVCLDLLCPAHHVFVRRGQGTRATSVLKVLNIYTL